MNVLNLAILIAKRGQILTKISEMQKTKGYLNSVRKSKRGCEMQSFNFIFWLIHLL